MKDHPPMSLYLLISPSCFRSHTNENLPKKSLLRNQKRTARTKNMRLRVRRDGKRNSGFAPTI